MRNVNKIGENFSDPPLVLQLVVPTENRSNAIGFIESDYGGPKLYKGWNASGGYTRTQFTTNARTGENVNRTQFYNTYGSGPKNDDFYDGQAVGLTSTNIDYRLSHDGKDYFWLPLDTNVLGQLFSDISVKFKRGYWPYHL